MICEKTRINFLKGLECHPNEPCNMGRTLNRFYKHVIKPIAYECMNEH